MGLQIYLALRIVIIPAGLTALALVAARAVADRPGLAARLVALGAGAGVLGALIGLVGVPPLPPTDSIGWIPIAALVTLLVLPFLEGRDRGVAIATVVIAAAAAFLVGRPAWSAAGAGTTALGIAGMMAAVTAVAWGLAWSSSTRLAPIAVYLAFTVAAVGGALSAVFSHSALLAMVLGGIAATAGTLAIGGAVLGVTVRGRAVAGLLAIPAAGVVLYARLFSALPVVSLLLLVAAALAPALAAAVPSFRGRSALAIVVAAVLAAGAATAAMRAGQAAEDAAGGHDASEDLYYR
jgi:hypothetical protein